MATLTVTSIGLSNAYIDVRITFDVTQSVANNSSTITITKLEVRDKLGYMGSFWAQGSILVDGSTAVNMRFSGTIGSAVNLLSKDWSTVNIGSVGGSANTPINPITVTHAANGTKSVSVAIQSFSIYRPSDGASVVHTDSTDTMTLPVINRVYTNTINHWATGFKNGEGNNPNGSGFHLGGTTFTAAYGSSTVLDASRALTIPKGFYLSSTFGTRYINGAWTSYPMGTSVAQKDSAGSFEYDYYPGGYTITYNLGGGTNNSANPTTYNVLYGVTFSAPTRAGYTFKGWTIGGKTVTGINPGANATFSSADDLYTKLASRTTGNVVVTAVWEAQGLVYIDNGAGFDAYQVYVDNGTSWDQYVPYIDNGTGWDQCS